MRIDFEDKSFIEMRLGNPGKIVIVLGAKNRNNNLKVEINACEIEINQFAQLISDLGVEIPKIKNTQ